jgi:hypothetical protein
VKNPIPPYGSSRRSVAEEALANSAQPKTQLRIMTAKLLKTRRIGCMWRENIVLPDYENCLLLRTL